MNKNLKIITLLVVAMPASSALAWSFSDALTSLKTAANAAYNSESANKAKSFLADRYERAATSAGVIRDAVIYNEDVAAVADSVKNRIAQIPSREQMLESTKNAFNGTVEYVKNTEQVKADIVASLNQVNTSAKQVKEQAYNYLSESALVAQAGNAVTVVKEVIAQHPTATKVVAGVTAAVVVAGTAMTIKSKLHELSVYSKGMEKDQNIILNAMQAQINTDMKRLGHGADAANWNEMRNSFNKDTVDFAFLNNNPCQVGKVAKELSDRFPARRVKAAAVAFEQAYVDYVTLGVSEKVLRKNLEDAKASLERNIALYRAAKQQ